MPQSETYCRMSFRPSATLITVVRRFVSHFFDELLEDAELASMIALAAHELLENAVKYSTDGEAVLTLELDEHAAEPEVRVTIENKAPPEHVERLRGIFDDLHASTSPAAFYEELLRAGVERATGSGVGLARIYAEADMARALDVTQDG